MKLDRLYQPRNPLFWIMMVLNLLSMALGWTAHTFQPGLWVSLVLVVFTIGNAVLGTCLTWRLVKS
jgi:hypothetical protein